VYFTGPAKSPLSVVTYSDSKLVEKFLNRGSKSVADAVRPILEDMDVRGFDALVDYSKKFDSFELNTGSIRIAMDEIQRQAATLKNEQKKAIEFAYNSTMEVQQEIAKSCQSVEVNSDFGCTKQVPVPIERVGFYVPGGLAPLPSSLLMAGTSARAAGVKDIVFCTPPRKEGINPATAYIMLKLKVNEAFWLGGVAAIWLMTNGISSICKPVDKICGPGNAYVAEAKSQVAQTGKVGIDMIAGPSEVLVLADDSANPEFIAADLLAQAEHGLDSSAVLVTDSEKLALAVQTDVGSQLAKMKRGKEIATSLENCGGIFVVGDLLNDGVDIANRFAAEHLELFCKKETEAAILKKMPIAGAVFVRTGEAFADYGMTGGNHILPTKRTARFSSGLSARDFLVWQYIEELTDDGQKKLAEMAGTFADMESLEAHANAARKRDR